MIDNKKMIIIPFMIFILLFIFISNSFASIDIKKDDNNYSFPDAPYKDRPFFILGTVEKPILFTPTYSIEEFKNIYNLDNTYQYEYLIANNYSNVSTLHIAFIFCYKDNTEYKYYTTVHQNKGWSNSRYKIVNNEWQLDGKTGDVATIKENILASSKDIFYEQGLNKANISQNSVFDTSNNNAFFQKTLLLPLQVVEITQVEEIPKAIVETMTTIIPIGLVVLSIFLVIFLVRLVVFRVT